MSCISKRFSGRSSSAPAVLDSCQPPFVECGSPLRPAARTNRHFMPYGKGDIGDHRDEQPVWRHAMSRHRKPRQNQSRHEDKQFTVSCPDVRAFSLSARFQTRVLPRGIFRGWRIQFCFLIPWPESASLTLCQTHSLHRPCLFPSPYQHYAATKPKHQLKRLKTCCTFIAGDF